MLCIYAGWFGVLAECSITVQGHVLPSVYKKAVNLAALHAHGVAYLYRIKKEYKLYSVY